MASPYTAPCRISVPYAKVGLVKSRLPGFRYFFIVIFRTP
jgi:hypothetical protein